MNFVCECSKHYYYMDWRNAPACNFAFETHLNLTTYHLKYKSYMHFCYYDANTPNKIFFCLSNCIFDLEKDFTYDLNFGILNCLEQELKRMAPLFSNFFIDKLRGNNYNIYDNNWNIILQFSGTESEFSKVFFKLIDNMEFL